MLNLTNPDLIVLPLRPDYILKNFKYEIINQKT